MKENALEQFIRNNMSNIPLVMVDTEGFSTEYFSTEYFSTEYFLLHSMEGLSKNKQETFKVLDMLCKKIDVTGEVYTRYTKHLMATGERVLISFDCFSHLCALLIMGSAVYSDVKFINSAFKMLDKFPADKVATKRFLHNCARNMLDSLIKPESRST